MSVVVRTPDDRILCMCKGADSIIIPRLHEGQDELIQTTSEHLEDCANEGLRTLIIAQKEVDPQDYKVWAMRYREAQAQMLGREKAIERVAEELEHGFTLIGSTAIEDKL